MVVVGLNGSKMTDYDYGSLILTRMMKGDTNYMSMLPCNYVAQEHEDELKVKQCA